MPGTRRHTTLAWISNGILLALVLLGGVAYTAQSRHGWASPGFRARRPGALHFAIHVLGRHWGVAVTVLLPYYVHRQKAFAKALILGEIVAVIASARPSFALLWIWASPAVFSTSCSILPHLL